MQPGGVDDTHHQVIVCRNRAPVTDQFTHAQQGHHIAHCRAAGVGIGKHWRHHQQATRIRAGIEHGQWLGHRHAAGPQRPRQCRQGHFLAGEVQTIGQPGQFTRLGIEYREVMVALGGWVPLALFILVADHIARAEMHTGLALELGALRGLDTRRPGVGQGPLQQWPGVAVELVWGDFVGKAEKPPQPVQALLLFIKPLGDTAETLAGQQLEALAQLLLVEGLRG